MSFAVVPKVDCPHVQDPLQFYEEFTNEQASVHQPCYQCGDTKENWMSLGPMHTVACSRYVAGHMSEYASSKGFCLAVSFSDLSVWCYECDSYIVSRRLRPILIRLHASKFGITPEESAAVDVDHPIVPPAAGSSTDPSTGRRNNKGAGVGYPHKTEEEVREHFDDLEVVQQKAREVAALVRASKHMVVYTGAGISTSAKIPDYRGPKGVWTLMNKGERVAGIDIEQALPTYAHYALRELGDRGLMKYLVSTNVDGLHRRSGVPHSQLAELHGNCYKEMCSKCDTEYLRTFDTTKTVIEHRNHVTGRRCDECAGLLKDTIIHFGENLPEKELMNALQHAQRSDLALVIGTSMRVQPACSLPKYAIGNHGKCVIVNLQTTPMDHESIVVHARSDQFMQLLMQELEIPVTHDAPIY